MDSEDILVRRAYLAELAEHPRRKLRKALNNKTRQRIWARDSYTCFYCGSKENLTVDHVIPSSRGGLDDDNNLVTACRTCNAKKSDKRPLIRPRFV